MISLMEPFVHKLKSSISAVSAPMLSQSYCLSSLLLCFIIKQGRHSPPPFKLSACQDWPSNATHTNSMHTERQTHTLSATHAAFCSGARLPAGSSRAALKDSGDPLHTLSPLLSDLYKTQVRKCVAFSSNHLHLNTPEMVPCVN